MIRKVHCEEGVRGFWRGNIAATYLWVSYSAVQVRIFIFLQKLFNPINIFISLECMDLQKNGGLHRLRRQVFWELLCAALVPP